MEDLGHPIVDTSEIQLGFQAILHITEGPVGGRADLIRTGSIIHHWQLDGPDSKRMYIMDGPLFIVCS